MRADGRKKIFFEAGPPLSQGLDDRAPPPSYLKVCIRHWTSLPADVLWGSFVTHSFLSVGEKWMRDKRTPKDVCGEATTEHSTNKFSRLPKHYTAGRCFRLTCTQTLFSFSFEQFTSTRERKRKNLHLKSISPHTSVWRALDDRGYVN